MRTNRTSLVVASLCLLARASIALTSEHPVETELVTDQSRFVHEVADDFWRAHFYSYDSIMAGLVRKRLTPAHLVEFVGFSREPSFTRLQSTNLTSEIWPTVEG